MITRRQTLVRLSQLALAATLPAGIIGSRPARAAGTPLSIGIGGYTFAYLPLLTAKAAGFLDAQGLDVTLVNANGGTNALAATLGGSVDVCGLVMSDIILAAAKGQKIQAFAPSMSQYASDAVISVAAAQKAGIVPGMPLKERMARLKGMALAISGRGSGTDKLWRYLLALGGLDPDKDVTLTVVKLDQMYPALKSGQIDGFNTTAPANNRAVDDGIAVWVARPSQGEVPGLEDFLYTVLGAKPDVLADKPDVIARLVAGLTKGAELVRNDPQQAGKVLHEQFFNKTDAALVVSTVVDQKATVAVPPVLTERQFEQNRDFMMRFGDAVKQVAYQDVMNTKWVKA
ncbi:MAG: ABC transporter substrate-binding protein [Pseudomonadota bacterium]|nr:ABC transporter substrate-binding protein [Hyphomicrobiales bacterium]